MMLTGLGSLSYGELAGERIKLGLMLHDPEEEHDCFSDNTHNSHYYDRSACGRSGSAAIERHRRQGRRGPEPGGPGAGEPSPRSTPRCARRSTRRWQRCRRSSRRADSGQMAYDQMLAEDNPAGNAMIQAGVDALVAQTRAIEAVVAALGLADRVRGLRQPRQPRCGVPVSAALAMLMSVGRTSHAWVCRASCGRRSGWPSRPVTEAGAAMAERRAIHRRSGNMLFVRFGPRARTRGARKRGGAQLPVLRRLVRGRRRWRVLPRGLRAARHPPDGRCREWRRPPLLTVV